MVKFPDHLPSSSHDRTRDPANRYPSLQERKAWEPYDDPHEREVTVPSVGGSRTGQDFPLG